MELEDLSFLLQKVDSLEKLSEKLEDFYEEKNANDFNKVKREMLAIQEGILNLVDPSKEEI